MPDNEIHDVRDIATRILVGLTHERADLATMGLLDAAVRIVRAQKGMGTPEACRELARVLRAIEIAELGAEPLPPLEGFDVDKGQG